MPKPTDPSQHEYMFSDDMKFAQKVVLLHPEDSQKFLIIRRAMHIHTRPGDWDFPGGNVLYGENHEDSLRREIKEETSLDVGELIPVSVTTTHNEDIYSLFIIHSGRALQDTVSLSSEHTEFKWVTLEEFLTIDTADFLHEAAQKALKK